MRGNANKSDPLRLYEKYRKTWTKQKAPGEKNHKDLRWSVREQMLEKHVVVKVFIMIFPINLNVYLDFITFFIIETESLCA